MLVGDIDDLEDYVNEKIVVIGKITGKASIFMRGPLIDVERFYPVKSKHTTTFYIDGNTKITVDDKKAGLLNITAGDYAEVIAEEEMAVEIKVKSPEYKKPVIISARVLVSEVTKRPFPF